ncbi:MAG: hypothetical protein WB780_22000 [Candidatus Acidiferrales bacterium]
MFPLRRPSPIEGHARTVLAGKGSLRRAQNRRALAGSAPFWRPTIATGGSDGNTIELEIRFNESELQKQRKEIGRYTASSFSHAALPPLGTNFMLIFRLENARHRKPDSTSQTWNAASIGPAGMYRVGA